MLGDEIRIDTGSIYTISICIYTKINQSIRCVEKDITPKVDKPSLKKKEKQPVRVFFLHTFVHSFV